MAFTVSYGWFIKYDGIMIVIEVMKFYALNNDVTMHNLG